jgi:hypothetical protein
MDKKLLMISILLKMPFLNNEENYTISEWTKASNDKHLIENAIS